MLKGHQPRYFTGLPIYYHQIFLIETQMNESILSVDIRENEYSLEVAQAFLLNWSGTGMTKS